MKDFMEYNLTLEGKIKRILVTGALILTLPVLNTAIGYTATRNGLNHETPEKGRAFAERMVEEYPEAPFWDKHYYMEIIWLANRIYLRQWRLQ